MLTVKSEGILKAMGMETAKMKSFVQLFSGVDGFRLGLERVGWKCVWSNEVDKYCCMVSRFHYGDGELVEGDIREVDAKQVPDHTLLCAGFPCQTFSVAGKRKALSEDRGTLFTHILRVASVKRPMLLLLENVKGLLSSDSGRTFATIIRALGNLGYLLEWQVLNSKYFGVPQNRERVFIVGHLRGASSRQIFPIGQSDGFLSEESESKDVCPTITSRYFKRGKTDPYIIQEHSHSGKDGKGRGFRIFEHQVPTLTQQMGTGGNNVPMVMPCLTPDRINKRQHGRRFKENGDPSFTLTGQDIHGIMIAKTLDRDGYLRSGVRPRDENGKPHLLPIGYRRIRRLTPVECERLQGFPDGWTEGVSDTQRYKLLGNAVTVNVIEFLGQKLKEALMEKQRQ